jgi:hypothetical protein
MIILVLRKGKLAKMHFLNKWFENCVQILGKYWIFDILILSFLDFEKNHRVFKNGIFGILITSSSLPLKKLANNFAFYFNFKDAVNAGIFFFFNHQFRAIWNLRKTAYLRQIWKIKNVLQFFSLKKLFTHFQYNFNVKNSISIGKTGIFGYFGLLFARNLTQKTNCVRQIRKNFFIFV